MKKMLAILASPRTEGNAATMLDIAVGMARQKGCEVTYVDLYQKNIAWCRGCMACKQTRSCVVEDDVKDIERNLKECDLAAVASPTYFANVPAPLKNVFDRLVGAVMDDNGGMIPKPLLSHEQKYLVLVTCSTPPPFDRLGGQSTGTVKAIKEFFHTSGMKRAGTVVFAGTKGKCAVPLGVAKKIEFIMEKI